MHVDDNQLIGEISAGSQLAFEMLMKRYERLVFKVCYLYLRESDSALDATQEVFITVFRKVGSLRNRTSFRSWLVRIASRHSLNRLRTRDRYRQHLDLESTPPPPFAEIQERDLIRQERRERVLAEVLRLNPRQRLAVALRYFEGLSVREIAEILNCSEGTARNMLFRSLRTLRRRLAPVPVESES